MTDESIEDLQPSDLGTLDYWERIYSEELNNFLDYGGVGEIWFGEEKTLKIIRWINATLKKDDKIIDVGCGNGITLLELANKGFEKLMGIDYSQKAIKLAEEIFTDNKISHIELKVCDILDSDGFDLPTNFKLVHDKGTYDAISLHPENALSKRLKYIENVYKILLPSGYLILSSCNWTKDELEKHFEDYFTIIHELPPDQFIFSGRKGNTVTQLVLQKKQ